MKSGGWLMGCSITQVGYGADKVGERGPLTPGPSPFGERGAREARFFLRRHEIPAFAGRADVGWC